MKNIIKYILLFILGLCLTIGGVLFSIGHSRVLRVDIKTYPKELIMLQEFVKKEFDLQKDAIIYDLRERNCDGIKNKKNYKYDYQVYIDEIRAPTYLKDTVALDKKIDSIGFIIAKCLPQKECHDSVCINYYLFDNVTKTAYYKKEKKYKIN